MNVKLTNNIALQNFELLLKLKRYQNEILDDHDLLKFNKIIQINDHANQHIDELL